MKKTASIVFKDSTELSLATKPKYQLIRDHLFAEITSGRLAPGDALPPEAKLAESLGLSRTTVRSALGELEEQGAIQRIQGRGTFVSSKQQNATRSQIAAFALIAPRLREGLYPSLIHGFEEASADREHQIIVSNSNNDSARQGDLILQMIDRQVAAVALVPVTVAKTPEYQVRQLQEHRIPVVFCHRSVKGVAAPCLTWNGRDVGSLAGKSLLQLGHRRVALITSHLQPKTQDALNGLYDSFVNADVEASGVEAVEYASPILMSSEETAKAIHKTLSEILGRPNPPTAILCMNLVDAEQVYLHAADFGLKIPNDLSLIYFGGAWRDHGIAQRLSCIAVAEHEIGKRTAELLDEMRTGKRAIDNNEQIIFPVSMLPGETMGAAPDGRKGSGN
jgi:GntR family transcriptional regulator of arabinose operon